MIRLSRAGVAPVTFGDTPVAIGRAPTNQVVLESASVSLVHALIVPLSHGYAVRDRGSTNGTRIVRGGSAFVVERETDVALADGDVLVVGGDRGEALEVELLAPPHPPDLERTLVLGEAPTGTRGEAARRATEDRAAAHALLALADDLGS